MPDDKELEELEKEEKRLRKLAEDIDNAEEDRYNELRIKRLQGKAAPAKKPDVTLESVEKAFEKKMAPHAERKDYQVSKEPAGHRTPQERQENPTWNWGKALLGKERRLAREIYDTQKELKHRDGGVKGSDRGMFFNRDRMEWDESLTNDEIWECGHKKFFDKEMSGRPWRTADGYVNVLRRLYEVSADKEGQQPHDHPMPKPGDEEYYFGEGGDYMDFLERWNAKNKELINSGEPAGNIVHSWLRVHD